MPHPLQQDHRHLFPRKGGLLGGIAMVALLLALTVWVGLLARNASREFNYIGVPADVRNTITVTGHGEITAIPDIATVSLGSVVERKTVAAAQQENTRIMNLLNDTLDEQGVVKQDIKTTNYSIYPRYEYARDSGERTLRGYEVSQNVTVKIRDLESIGDILAAAGETGLNQIGSITFTIDDPEMLKDDAREMALVDAREKAQALSGMLGVKLRRVAGFNESGSPTPYPLYRYDDYALGMGAAEAKAVVAPQIEPGSTDITVDVSVTYEIE